MSYYLALEMPFLYKIESNISDLILYNSVETQEAINKRVKIAKSRQLVFPNPVPDSFYTKPRKETLKIKKVIAISNHLTLEVKKALKLLNEQNISTEFIGLPNNQKIVDEKLLKNVDVVISIGKTVQYCLATATPVYCYDHFGGPGYLNTHNFGKAKKLNFSGRGFKRKNSNTIKNEIIKGFLQNQKDIISLRRKFGDSFKLSENMNTIFTKVNNNPKPNKTINKYDLISAIDINEIRVSDQQAIYAQNIYILHSDLFIKKAKSDLDYVKNSMSWKVTKPLRNINDAIGKLKSRKQK